jgi:hypothetical protein
MEHRTTCTTSPDKTANYTDFYCREVEGPHGGFILRHKQTLTSKDTDPHRPILSVAIYIDLYSKKSAESVESAVKIFAF